jgi:DNA polymerase V
VGRGIGIAQGGFDAGPGLETSLKEKERKKRAMALVDKLNSSFTDSRVHFAAEGTKKEWKRRPENCSPRFTTRWDELLIVKN